MSMHNVSRTDIPVRSFAIVRQECLTYLIVFSFIVLTVLQTTEYTAAETLDPSLAVRDTSGTILWYVIRRLNVEDRGWSETAEFYDRLYSCP